MHLAQPFHIWEMPQMIIIWLANELCHFQFETAQIQQPEWETTYIAYPRAIQMKNIQKKASRIAFAYPCNAPYILYKQSSFD